jgi:hypothetical protein
LLICRCVTRVPILRKERGTDDGRDNQLGRFADTLRPDPDFVPIKDAALLRELSERLYERNFDPEIPDSKNGMKLAISKFQEKSNLTPSGEATEGVLTRLRKLDDLKPWGSIVYGPDNNNWGISWNHKSQGSRRRRTLQMRIRQVPDRTKLLRQRVRGFRGFRQIMVTGPARHRAKGQGCRA